VETPQRGEHLQDYGKDLFATHFIVSRPMSDRISLIPALSIAALVGLKWVCALASALISKFIGGDGDIFGDVRLRHRVLTVSAYG
jgi:hypothetical protein